MGSDERAHDGNRPWPRRLRCRLASIVVRRRSGAARNGDRRGSRSCITTHRRVDHCLVGNMGGAVRSTSKPGCCSANTDIGHGRSGCLRVDLDGEFGHRGGRLARRCLDRQPRVRSGRTDSRPPGGRHRYHHHGHCRRGARVDSGGFRSGSATMVAGDGVSAVRAHAWPCVCCGPKRLVAVGHGSRRLGSRASQSTPRTGNERICRRIDCRCGNPASRNGSQYLDGYRAGRLRQ